MAGEEPRSCQLESLDFLSDKFDPLRALYTQELQAPFPNIQVFNNLAEYARVIKEGKPKPTTVLPTRSGPSKRTRNLKPEFKPVDINTRLTEIAQQRAATQGLVLGSGEKSPFLTEGLSGRTRDLQQIDRRWKKKYKNVLERMEECMSGPFNILYKCLKERYKVQVWIRKYKGLRSVVTGYVIAFDKHMNLALMDVDELYTVEERASPPPLQEPKTKKKKKKKRKKHSQTAKPPDDGCKDKENQPSSTNSGGQTKTCIDSASFLKQMCATSSTIGVNYSNNEGISTEASSAEQDNVLNTDNSKRCQSLASSQDNSVKDDSLELHTPNTATNQNSTKAPVTKPSHFEKQGSSNNNLAKRVLHESKNGDGSVFVTMSSQAARLNVHCGNNEERLDRVNDKTAEKNEKNEKSLPTVIGESANVLGQESMFGSTNPNYDKPKPPVLEESMSTTLFDHNTNSSSSKDVTPDLFQNQISVPAEPTHDLGLDAFDTTGSISQTKETKDEQQSNSHLHVPNTKSVSNTNSDSTNSSYLFSQDLTVRVPAYDDEASKDMEFMLVGIFQPKTNQSEEQETNQTSEQLGFKIPLSFPEKFGFMSCVSQPEKQEKIGNDIIHELEETERSRKQQQHLEIGTRVVKPESTENYSESSFNLHKEQQQVESRETAEPLRERSLNQQQCLSSFLPQAESQTLTSKETEDLNSLEMKDSDQNCEEESRTVQEAKSVDNVTKGAVKKLDCVTDVHDAKQDGVTEKIVVDVTGYHCRKVDCDVTVAPSELRIHVTEEATEVDDADDSVTIMNYVTDNDTTQVKLDMMERLSTEGVTEVQSEEAKQVTDDSVLEVDCVTTMCTDDVTVVDVAKVNEMISADDVTDFYVSNKVDEVSDVTQVEGTTDIKDVTKKDCVTDNDVTENDAKKTVDKTGEEKKDISDELLQISTDNLAPEMVSKTQEKEHDDTDKLLQSSAAKTVVQDKEKIDSHKSEKLNVDDHYNEDKIENNESDKEEGELTSSDEEEDTLSSKHQHSSKTNIETKKGSVWDRLGNGKKASFNDTQQKSKKYLNQSDLREKSSGSSKKEERSRTTQRNSSIMKPRDGSRNRSKNEHKDESRKHSLTERKTTTDKDGKSSKRKDSFGKEKHSSQKGHAKEKSTSDKDTAKDNRHREKTVKSTSDKDTAKDNRHREKTVKSTSDKDNYRCPRNKDQCQQKNGRTTPRDSGNEIDDCDTKNVRERIRTKVNSNKDKNQRKVSEAHTRYESKEQTRQELRRRESKHGKRRESIDATKPRDSIDSHKEKKSQNGAQSQSSSKQMTSEGNTVKLTKSKQDTAKKKTTSTGIKRSTKTVQGQTQQKESTETSKREPHSSKERNEKSKETSSTRLKNSKKSQEQQPEKHQQSQEESNVKGCDEIRRKSQSTNPNQIRQKRCDSLGSVKSRSTESLSCRGNSKEKRSNSKTLNLVKEKRKNDDEKQPRTFRKNSSTSETCKQIERRKETESKPTLKENSSLNLAKPYKKPGNTQELVSAQSKGDNSTSVQSIDKKPGLLPTPTNAKVGLLPTPVTTHHFTAFSKSPGRTQTKKQHSKDFLAHMRTDVTKDQSMKAGKNSGELSNIKQVDQRKRKLQKNKNDNRVLKKLKITEHSGSQEDKTLGGKSKDCMTKRMDLGKGKFLSFHRRHVNQLFIRGDNVVMVSYAV